MLLLAQMKHAPALELCGTVLKADPKEYYWQSVFVFGQYGDMAVPFLLDRIADPDTNVRYNAVSLVGTWLIAPEAHMALRERYFEEPDALIRGEHVAIGRVLGACAGPEWTLHARPAMFEGLEARGAEDALEIFVDQARIGDSRFALQRFQLLFL